MANIAITHLACGGFTAISPSIACDLLVVEAHDRSAFVIRSTANDESTERVIAAGSSAEFEARSGWFKAGETIAYAYVPSGAVLVLTAGMGLQLSLSGDESAQSKVVGILARTQEILEIQRLELEKIRRGIEMLIDEQISETD
jgi:hypothetical protein